MTRLSGHNQQKNHAQDQLLAAVMRTSEERFQQTLLGMSGQDCATALEWLVFRLYDTQDKIADFAALVHRVYGNQLAHHPEVAQIMATEIYAEAISGPAARVIRTKREKLAKKEIITKAWGDGWVEQAASCMFYRSGLNLG
jgi:hypothetical protein